METLNRKLFPMCVIVAAGLALGACHDDDDETPPQEGMASLDLGVSDAPVDEATAVVVQFTGVEMQAQSGNEPVVVTFDAPRQIDLLALQGSNQEFLLDDMEVPAGRYSFIRLMVDAESGVQDSYIELDDGSVHSLFIPSGSQSGLQLNGPFELAADAPTAFTIDFDLRKSVHDPQGQPDYFLRPTLRIVDTAQAGHIAGTATLAQLQDPSCTNDLAADTGSAVYAYQGFDAAPDDVGGSGAQVVSAGMVKLDSASGEYGFEIGFLIEGQYTVSLTCQASDDDPQTNDEIVFAESINVEVTAGQTSNVAFGTAGDGS